METLRGPFLQEDEEPLMSTDLQLETDLAMAQRPGQKQWPTDECATALKIPKASPTALQA